MNVVRSLALLLVLGGMASMGCGPSASTAPPPHSAAQPVAPDGGLPVPAPSQKKGVIMPSDTGLGQQPAGGGPSTGTNDRTVGPTLGNPGN